MSMLAGREANVFAVAILTRPFTSFVELSEHYPVREEFPATRIVCSGRSPLSFADPCAARLGLWPKILKYSRPQERKDSTLRSRFIKYSERLGMLRHEESAKPKQGSRAPRRNRALGDTEVEAADLAGRIQKTRKAERCKWSDFAVLYRQHSHRNQLVREFTERGIPFSIEGWTFSIARGSRRRRLLSARSRQRCASLFRVAACAVGISPSNCAPP